jgi:single-stranded DNA-binding protein
MNRCCLSGYVGQYGVKISWTEAGKPQTSLTLVVEDGGYKTFIPILVVGPKAEAAAETLNPGDAIEVEGRLAWKAGRTKEFGKLVVMTFSVDRLQASSGMPPVSLEGQTEIVDPGGAGEVTQPKKGRPRYAWKPAPTSTN